MAKHNVLIMILNLASARVHPRAARLHYDAGAGYGFANELERDPLSVGAPRLRAAGLDIPPAPPLPHPPKISLYLAIGADHPGDAHSRYNALIRRLVSVEWALERRVRAELQAG